MPMARVTGLEPATSGVTGRRSNQLSYTRKGRPGIKAGATSRQAPDVVTLGVVRMGGDGIEPPALSV